MNSRLKALKGLITVCDNVDHTIQRQIGVKGREVDYHGEALANFEAEAKGKFILSWHLIIQNNAEVHEGRIPPYHLEVTLLDNDSEANLIVIRCFPTNDDCSWRISIESLIDEHEAVHDLVIGWALTCGTYVVDRHKALRFIESLATFYTKLPAA